MVKSIFTNTPPSQNTKFINHTQDIPQELPELDSPMTINTLSQSEDKINPFQFGKLISMLPKKKMKMTKLNKQKNSKKMKEMKFIAFKPK